MNASHSTGRYLLGIGIILLLMGLGVIGTLWWWDGGIAAWLLGHRLPNDAFMVLIDCGITVMVGIAIMGSSMSVRAIGWGMMLCRKSK